MDAAEEAAFLLTAEMDPPTDEHDFNAWYDQEHVPMVAKMAGYVRCRRYIVATDECVVGEHIPKYLTIHEVNDLNGFAGPEARASGSTEWTRKNMSQMKSFHMRGWKSTRA